MGEITDTQMLDFLQEELDKRRYTGRVAFRVSENGRGMRLHETSRMGSFNSVRSAIKDAMQSITHGAIDE